ncbi:MAG: carbohydrate kinase [Citrobacter freundii]|nr:MAG: carbohydrate kinase [Citrobacter freundii]
MNAGNNNVICFGEVLWDILPSGAAPGGAPVNVAYHLQKQGVSTAVITRVGTDKEGEELQQVFAEKGVNTSWFQYDDQYETGKVYAKLLSNHDVEYDIVQPVAWDHIAWDQRFDQLLRNTSFFVYGSLAARNDVSRDTLFKLLDIPCKKVFDVNLRSGFYTRERITELLGRADFVKMNLAELDLITGWYRKLNSIEDRLRFFCEQFNIKQAVVTMGSDGAVFFDDGGIIQQKGLRVNVKDTVGSGDAFLAGLLSQLIRNTNAQDALRFANQLGAFVATQHGPCPEYDTSPMKTLDFMQSNLTI